MAPYLPIHHLGFTPREEIGPDAPSAFDREPTPIGRDEADALKRMGIILTVVALFLFLVAMIGR